MGTLILALRRRVAEDDRGISIVEVMVAITLLAVTMAATASGVVRSLQVASDSRNTVVAANIAQFELERLRSIPFADWVTSIRDGSQSDTLTTTFNATGPNGIPYQVYREANWVAVDSETTDCSVFGTGEGEADYVRVRQVVTFPDQPDLAPVENVTVITPRLDDSDAYTGHLAVMVRDRDGVGTQGHTVRIQGAAGVELATTDTAGCAFFALLPVDPDDPTDNEYEITIDTAGYVDRVTKVQAIDYTAVVSAQSTTVVEFSYDEAVSYDLFPTFAAAPFPNCVAQRVEFAAPNGADDPTAYAAQDPEPPTYRPVQQAIECRRNGTALDVNGNLDVPSDGVPPWQAFLPYNIAYTIYNPSTDFSPIGRVTTYPSLVQSAIPDASSVARPDGEICGLFNQTTGACESRVLFPYTGGYTVHPGRCPATDPVVAFGASGRQALDAEPGTDHGIEVPMALVTVTTARPGPGGLTDIQTVANADVYIDMRDTTNCPNGERLYLGRSNAQGQLKALVPYGSWVFHWDNPNVAGTGVPTTPFNCNSVLAEGRPYVCHTIHPAGTGATGGPSAGYVVYAGEGDLIYGGP